MRKKTGGSAMLAEAAGQFLITRFSD